jgi:hypothetical protein
VCWAAAYRRTRVIWDPTAGPAAAPITGVWEGQNALRTLCDGAACGWVCRMEFRMRAHALFSCVGAVGVALNDVGCAGVVGLMRAARALRASSTVLL